jgi:hypothetical protein
MMWTRFSARTGYIPETLLYVMFGQPERVYLRDPIMAADGERSHV